MVQSKLRIVAPRAAALLESMRDVGYTLGSAMADIIDNSISAGATRVDLFADTTSDDPSFAFIDDGCGMLEDDLVEAMRPGSRSPLDTRARADLGRFGLGLKTASFSQCRRLTVVSRKDGQTCCARWDLDHVAKTDAWQIELLADLSTLPHTDKLDAHGTLVLWEKLDRLLEAGTSKGQADLARQIDEATRNVELVFHRFLRPERSAQSIDITLNGRLLKAHEPFNVSSPATICGPIEHIKVGGADVELQAFTLPHHSKVTQTEWERFAGPEGYTKNQGFYIYRNRRLIIHGTWFGLARQTEATKLSRVRVDITNELDSLWKIDVKKGSAQLPSQMRERLRRIVEQIGATSKRVYSHRGQRLTSARDAVPIWVRVQDKSMISYEIMTDHPTTASFRAQLSETLVAQFQRILRLISSALPLDALLADLTASPEQTETVGMSNEDLRDLAQHMYSTLRGRGLKTAEIERMMLATEPFRSNQGVVRESLKEVVDECDS